MLTWSSAFGLLHTAFGSIVIGDLRHCSLHFALGYNSYLAFTNGSIDFCTTDFGSMDFSQFVSQLQPITVLTSVM